MWRKLGTLKELLPEHGPTRDDVVAWCKEQCKLETLKYKEEQKSKSIQITCSEKIRNYNHMGNRVFIVTQSIKKLKAEDKEWALNPVGFKSVSDDKNVDITTLPDDDTGLYYKEEPYTPHTLHQRLIVTYSPKYARYQKTIRDKQVDRAKIWCRWL